MRRWMLSVSVTCALFGIVTRAHHSISAIYDDSRRTTIEGTVSQFQFVNPHPMVLAHMREGDGEPRLWRLEMDNRLELVQIGFTRETLQPGDRIVVIGSPARTDAQSLYIRRLDRLSDGFWYEQVGTTPRIGSR